MTEFKQPMHPRLASRVVANALINYQMDLENDPELGSPDDTTVKLYLRGSTDCVVYPHQMPDLVEAFKKELEKP